MIWIDQRDPEFALFVERPRANLRLDLRMLPDHSIAPMRKPECGTLLPSNEARYYLTGLWCPKPVRCSEFHQSSHLNPLLSSNPKLSFHFEVIKLGRD